MKKSTIVSIVLALILAANVAAAVTPTIAKKKAEAAVLKRDKLFRHNHNNDKKKRDDECYVITCVDEGETCDDDDTLICKGYMYCDNAKCAPPKGEGEPCSDYSECGGYLLCNMTYDDETPSVCISYPQKVGDSCSFYSDYCPTGTKCVYGVCTIYPTTVGADCIEEVGCDNNLYCNSEHKCAEYPKAGENCLNGKCADYLYCDDKSNKCEENPGEGETCYNNYQCGIDLYCDDDSNKCVKLPVLGEECDYFYGCASGLVCDRDYDSRKDICYNKIGSEGEHCSYSVSCGDGLICNYNNKCVVGECEYDFDCPSGKGCSSFKCIDFMTLNDGEECGPIESSGFSCKEGSGCGRNESSSTGYSCMKITTKISEERVCENDDDCPSDSYCYCNSNNGKRQCIPYFVSNKTALKYYKKYLALATTDEYSYEFTVYSIFISQYAYPVDEEYMCLTVNYTILEGEESSSSDSIKFFPIWSLSSGEGPIVPSDSGSIASNMKPSFALSAVLFVFGLIAAIF